MDLEPLAYKRELDVEVEVGSADEVHDGPAVKEAVHDRRG
jgi:hypothetical protein